MALAGVAGATKRPRTDPIGTVSLSRGNQVGRALGEGFFNHFPQIIAAFPGALSDIIRETTEHLAERAQAGAPVQANPRAGDPTPGTLRSSKKTRYFRRRGTDLVVTGRVDFKAKDPRGHAYARPVETGSIRHIKRAGRNIASLHETRVAARHFLVPALMEERPLFVARLQGLEARLPR